MLRSEWDVAPHLATGQLIAVLPAWQLPPADVMLVYPTRSDLSAKTRALVDFLGTWFASNTLPRPQEAGTPPSA